MKESFDLSLNADIHEIPRVSAALEQVMQVHSFSAEEILDTQLAVEEAMTNIINHGYKGRAGKVRITGHTVPEMIEIRIEDSAPPFNPLLVPSPDFSSAVQDRNIGGLGIFLIRKVMDEVIYHYEKEKNILILIKRKSG